ncbi:MAG: hypothetical protein RSE14_02490 [Erythrobacter sp.]|jgi:hypothetical protein|uniref:hypothetical protein n=1 Tax=Erythrobacter sp. TaxID=1042 RepID=UPI002B45C57B|nr:hypothetical protein [Erythrobacter sp.]WRH70981.1 MAG: hypothetical protein RSE14_02490 [Erythrobacter sp.]
MSGSVITIRRRWWAHCMMLIPIGVFPVLCAVMAMAAVDILAEPGGWWRAPILLIGSGVMGLAFVIALNALFTYRVELDARGLRIIGNLYTHDITWDEITQITKRHNYRAPGYHVGIEVDGSNLPVRHWCNLWVKGYLIHPGMEKGGIALTAYLKRKRREYLKRQQTETSTT